MVRRVSCAVVFLLLLSSLGGSAQTPTVERVVSLPGQVALGAPFTEGPTADNDGNIYFADLPHRQILKLGTDGKLSTFREGVNSPGLTTDAQGRLLAVEGGNEASKTPDRITRTDLKTGRVEVLAESVGANTFGRPNDLTVDGKGRIFFSGGGEVYRLDPDGRVTKVAASPLVQGSNGVVVSLDDRTLYLVEQNRGAGEPRRIRAFDVSADGALSNPRVFHDFSPGRGGDGMAIDSQGNIYVAAGMNELRGSSETLDNKAGIYVFSPSGALLRTIPIPMDTLTNLCFGGPDLKTVYVTSGNTLFRFRNETAGTRR